MEQVNINNDIFEDYVHTFGCVKCDENSIYDAVEESLGIESVPLFKQSEAVNQCPAVRQIVMKFLRLRIVDPAAFDILCFKVVSPHMKYKDILKALGGIDEDLSTLPVRMIAKHKARISEALYRLIEIFPDLAGLLNIEPITKRDKLVRKIWDWIHKNNIKEVKTYELVARIRGIDNKKQAEKLLMYMTKSKQIKKIRDGIYVIKQKTKRI